MSALDRLQLYLSECPLIAIIRGVTPQEAEAIGDALFDAGIRCRASAAHCRSSTGLHGAALKIIQKQFELLP